VEAPVEQGRGSQMLIEERRQYIVALAQQHGRVLVEELSQSLGISRITIRKDLDYLQRRGALQRTHGGALLPGSGRCPILRCRRRKGATRARSSGSQRRRGTGAGRTVRAAGLRHDDDGDRAALKKFSHLTIITNAVNIAAS
jgi:DeoR family transcriptional regulator of aga operon